jgi:hypothetical protein
LISKAIHHPCGAQCITVTWLFDSLEIPLRVQQPNETLIKMCNVSDKNIDDIELKMNEDDHDQKRQKMDENIESFDPNKRMKEFSSENKENTPPHLKLSLPLYDKEINLMDSKRNEDLQSTETQHASSFIDFMMQMKRNRNQNELMNDDGIIKNHRKRKFLKSDDDDILVIESNNDRSTTKKESSKRSTVISSSSNTHNIRKREEESQVVLFL